MLAPGGTTAVGQSQATAPRKIGAVAKGKVLVSDGNRSWEWRAPRAGSPSQRGKGWGYLSRFIGSPDGKPHLMPASRTFVDANSCVASFGKPLNPSNLHHFATPTIGQFGTAGH